MRIKKFSLVLIVIVIILLIAVWIISGLVKNTNTSKINQQPSTSPTYTSDPVKNQNGSNGDTQPSSNGTGPGSNNSLLGP